MAKRVLETRDYMRSPFLQYVAPYINAHGGRIAQGDISSVVFPNMASQRMALGFDTKSKKPFIGIQKYEADLFRELPIKEIVFMRQIQSNQGAADFVIVSLDDLSQGQGLDEKGEQKTFPFHLWYPVQKGRLDIFAFSDEEMQIQLVEMTVSSRGEISFPDELNPEEEAVFGSFPLIRAGTWKHVPLKSTTPIPDGTPRPGEGLPDIEALPPAVIGDREPAEENTASAGASAPDTETRQADLKHSDHQVTPEEAPKEDINLNDFEIEEDTPNKDPDFVDI